MLSEIITISCCIIFPWAIYYYRSTLQSKLKIDYILMAYGLGMILKFFSGNFFSQNILQSMIYLSIPLAMPLLIFQADFFSWLKNAPLTVKGFIITCLSTCLVGILIGKYYIQDEMGKKIIAMLIGVFIGGSANLNAIGLSLNTPFEVIAIANTVDLMASGIFILFMLFFAKPLFTKILPFPFPKNTHQPSSPTIKTGHENKISQLIPLFLSVISLGISLGISYLLFSDINIPFLMLMITFWGILGSLNKTIRSYSMSEVYGNYLITVFCFSMGLILDIQQIFNHFDTLFLASLALIFLSLFLQVLFCRIFKINAEIMMICSIACVMSPAFIPMFVKHYQNDELLLPGITTGLAGFAIANLLGLGVFSLL